MSDCASSLPFVKMQAVGNDFVVVEEGDAPEGIDWSHGAVGLCDRHFGVGADGLLVTGSSPSAELRMRMFNPDGTEDMCGNGLRCVIQHAYERRRVSSSGAVETLAGIRPFTINADGSITTDMATPRFSPADLPVDPSVFRAKQRNLKRVEHVPVQAKGISFWISGVVNTGSTHAVVFTHTAPTDDEFFFWSPRVEQDQLFPERTSLMWAVVETPHRLRLRIWERGAGETLGCGTGACAAAVVARLQGEVAADAPITVVSRGGELQVVWSGREEDSVYLTGRASTVFSGAWTGVWHRTDQ